MKLRNKKLNNGFSLVEFLIGMAMTVIIFIVATNLVISFLTVNTKSKRSQDLEQAKTDVYRVLSDILTWGQDISFSESSLDVDGNKYEVRDFALYKNDEPITPKNVKVTEFSVKEFQNTGDTDTQISYQVEVWFEHTESSSISDHISIFSSTRAGNTEVTTEETPSP